MIKTIDILSGLANKNRLRVFLVLLERDFCVCELQEILNIEQSRLSHQLRTLRYRGLVDAKQYGRWIVYSVPEKLRENPVIKSIKNNSELSPLVREKIPQVSLRGIRENNKTKLARRKQE